MSFLKEQGEGIHHVSFGAVEGHDQIISGLTASQLQVPLEPSGFTVFAMLAGVYFPFS
jgi:hypothetical protein